MIRYTIIVTTHNDQRLFYRTNNSKLILFMHECATRALNIQTANTLSLDELFIVDAYLDHPKSCEVIDSQLKQSVFLPV
ncbi:MULTISPECIES: hypothetical protein [unclassified Lysinibacillus]|uniref:hypothetical protein n=1 Tax=unclassified Lysinibacillus TaxID=2636778 RepID=UPI001091DFE8|nr:MULTISPECIES: hypothetical protein [unclassified Lysinibacillus]TGN31155.1 hypothetical protein E4L99_17060 [Lysinibacillus sp. S2017]